MTKQRERGATMAEAALIVALIGALAVAALTFLGGGVAGGFDDTAGAFGSETDGTPGEGDSELPPCDPPALTPPGCIPGSSGNGGGGGNGGGDEENAPCDGPPWGPGGKPDHCKDEENAPCDGPPWGPGGKPDHCKDED